ncbi:Fic/DOC family N-terminal domain-containing protein [Prosthecobacter vanneervenii]|uniref:Fic family protein n=1 Tax=Prosthecobacter vanneervenii TaxID=48466 RepID=A0A7W7YG83_9BACT|nr:Fic/DOC family N-terminal domain-containing protein [Prosthecobacter vanneervenii]MBB5035442.1 Fic family protein [Prosthecobacter vanneervenii]
MTLLKPLPLPNLHSLETAKVWKALRDAHRSLAELKGVCAALPNPAILVDTLAIQEAKDSSGLSGEREDRSQ